MEALVLQLNLLKHRILALNAVPMDKRTEPLAQLNLELADLGKQSILTTEQASARWQAETLMDSYLREVRAEADRRQRLLERHQLEMTEEGSERFFGPQQLVLDAISQRLRTNYGWNGKNAGARDKGTFITKHEGIGMQGLICRGISELLNSGLAARQEVQDALASKGQPAQRANRWIGLPMLGNSPGDLVGADYLLVSRATAEFYPLDVTPRGHNLQAGSIVESRLRNPHFPS